MGEQLNVILESLKSFWAQFVFLLPKVLGSLVLVVLGWLLAKAFRKGTMKILKLLRVDEMAERSGIEDFLLQGGVRYTTVTLIGNLVYWLVLFTSILALLNMLGMQVAAELFNRIIFYIPNVIVAMIVLIFGTLFAKVIQGITFTYLNNVGISGAQMMGSIAQYAVLIFVVSLALEQLSIGGLLLISAFQIAFGALCLALALAFGLGGREWAAHVLEKLWKK
jgi:hypothetical protein